MEDWIRRAWRQCSHKPASGVSGVSDVTTEGNIPHRLRLDMKSVAHVAAIRTRALSSRHVQRLRLLDCRKSPGRSANERHRQSLAPCHRRVRERRCFSPPPPPAGPVGAAGRQRRCREYGSDAYLSAAGEDVELLEMIRLLRSGATTGDVVTRHTLEERRRPLRLLVAEDNPVNQRLATVMLEKEGHQVVLAED